MMFMLANGVPVLSLIIEPETFVGVSTVCAIDFMDMAKNKKTTKYFIN